MRIVHRATGQVIPDVTPMPSLTEKVVGLRLKAEGNALFSFASPVREPLDMMLVPRPLDIAFLDEEMQVMEVQGAHPVTLDPSTWRRYRPDEPYRYVLEVDAGLLPSMGVERGDAFAPLVD